jgi:hypothetical protein
MIFISRYLVLILLLLGASSPAISQTLLERLKYSRISRIVALKNGDRIRKVQVVGPAMLGTRADSLLQWFRSRRLDARQDSVQAPAKIVIDKWHKISAPERIAYRSQFDTTRWAFIGNSSLNVLDTMPTREIRARMEAVFGRPTSTLAELHLDSLSRREDYIEFEYWFVVNDSIPLLIMDVNGPWDRGVVIASKSSLRDQLASIKTSFLWQLLDGIKPESFADYYYNFEQDSWYVTGFDGASFFDVRTGRPSPGFGRPDPAEFGSRRIEDPPEKKDH